jgi:hypothetical protein
MTVFCPFCPLWGGRGKEGQDPELLSTFPESWEPMLATLSGIPYTRAGRMSPCLSWGPGRVSLRRLWTRLYASRSFQEEEVRESSTVPGTAGTGRGGKEEPLPPVLCPQPTLGECD